MTLTWLIFYWLHVKHTVSCKCEQLHLRFSVYLKVLTSFSLNNVQLPKHLPPYLSLPFSLPPQWLFSSLASPLPSLIVSGGQIYLNLRQTLEVDHAASKTLVKKTTWSAPRRRTIQEEPRWWTLLDTKNLCCHCHWQQFSRNLYFE